MRSTPVCQAGSVRAKVLRSLLVDKREFAGRLAGVGNALVGTGAMAEGATRTGCPAARANSITCFA